MKTQRQRRILNKDGGRDWVVFKPKAAKDYQLSPVTRTKDPKKNQLYQCLHFRLVALITLREHISEKLSSMVFCYGSPKELMHKHPGVNHFFLKVKSRSH